MKSVLLPNLPLAHILPHPTHVLPLPASPLYCSKHTTRSLLNSRYFCLQSMATPSGGLWTCGQTRRRRRLSPLHSPRASCSTSLLTGGRNACWEQQRLVTWHAHNSDTLTSETATSEGCHQFKQDIKKETGFRKYDSRHFTVKMWPNISHSQKQYKNNEQNN